MKFLNEYAAFIQVLVSGGLAMITVGLLRATRNMANSTKLLADESRTRREDAKKPQILAKLKPNSDDGVFIGLVLSNVGLGAALNVRFRLEGDEGDFSNHEVTLRGPSEPINFISRGESEVYELGTGSGASPVRGSSA